MLQVLQGFITIKNIGIAATLCLSLGCEERSETKVRVYITKTGNCYHTRECSYLGKSIIPMWLNEAIAEGYAPCRKCGATQIIPQKK